MSDESTAAATGADFSLTVTDTAARRVQEIATALGFAADRAGLRVGVVEGGCSGLNYDVHVVAEPAADDRVYTFNGTRVFVNEFSVPYVKGMSVDWISTFQESRFVFQNPNATGGCGCGISFTVE